MAKRSSSNSQKINNSGSKTVVAKSGRELPVAGSEYETIFHAVEDAVFLVDVRQDSGGLTFIFERNNASHKEQTGLEPEAFHGRTPREVLGDEEGGRVEARYRECVKKEQPIEYEETLTLPDGERAWETKLTPVFREGKVDKLVGVARDITEQKERERRTALLQASTDAIMVLAPDGTVRYVNQASKRVLRCQTGELIGGNIADHVADEYTSRVMSVLDRLGGMEPGAVDTVEYQFECSRCDGEIRWVKSTIKNTLDNPAIDGLLVTTQDITEQKEREQQLEQFKEAVELSAHAIYITDRGGTIQYVNPAFETITGYSREEAIGQQPQLLKSGEYDDAFYQKLWETILDGEQWEAEMVNEQADGERLVLNQTVAPLTDEDGEPQKFVAVAQDITERKEYEEALENQRDNLELLNQIVRHDVRNDLQLVLIYAETLESHVDTDGEEYIRQILEATRDAVDITKTARDVTEVLLQSDTDCAPIRLRYALENQVDEVRSSSEHALVTVGGQVPEINILADDMLESVFRNLLKNAVVHNDKEVPEVTASVTTTDEVARVRITDNGPGIPDDKKDQIFEEGETALDSDGTGIGLYLVETLVNRYGGDVWVEDNEPDGSVFVVELPRPA